jgi:hypothetical protein
MFSLKKLTFLHLSGCFLSALLIIYAYREAEFMVFSALCSPLLADFFLKESHPDLTFGFEALVNEGPRPQFRFS